MSFRPAVDRQGQRSASVSQGPGSAGSGPPPGQDGFGRQPSSGPRSQGSAGGSLPTINVVGPPGSGQVPPRIGFGQGNPSAAPPVMWSGPIPMSAGPPSSQGSAGPPPSDLPGGPSA